MGWDGLNDIGWLWWWNSKKGWVCFFSVLSSLQCPEAMTGSDQ